MGKSDLSERFLHFSVKVIQITDGFRRTAAGHHIGNQLMRSATSGGANYEKACAAESRADFIQKLQIVLKELRESNYWLRLSRKTNVFSSHVDILPEIIQESLELMNIIAKSIVTVKNK